MSPRGLVVVEAAELVRMIDTAVRRALDARSEPRADGEWIDTRAAAELLGVSTRQIAKLAAGGRGRPARLSSSRVGRLLRFRRADVLAMLEGGA
ncbi:MAG: helix-turn-helix domain-containing protein [Sandaracinaceae bacterium]|nr:helix-turn-helix domain-containing protein [Sandaracinaceae bacterium]